MLELAEDVKLTLPSVNKCVHCLHSLDLGIKVHASHGTKSCHLVDSYVKQNYLSYGIYFSRGLIRDLHPLTIQSILERNGQNAKTLFFDDNDCIMIEDADDISDTEEVPVWIEDREHGFDNFRNWGPVEEACVSIASRKIDSTGKVCFSVEESFSPSSPIVSMDFGNDLRPLVPLIACVPSSHGTRTHLGDQFISLDKVLRKYLNTRQGRQYQPSQKWISNTRRFPGEEDAQKLFSNEEGSTRPLSNSHSQESDSLWRKVELPRQSPSHPRVEGELIVPIRRMLDGMKPAGEPLFASARKTGLYQPSLKPILEEASDKSRKTVLDYLLRIAEADRALKEKLKKFSFINAFEKIDCAESEVIELSEPFSDLSHKFVDDGVSVKRTHFISPHERHGDLIWRKTLLPYQPQLDLVKDESIVSVRKSSDGKYLVDECTSLQQEAIAGCQLPLRLTPAWEDFPTEQACVSSARTSRNTWFTDVSQFGLENTKPISCVLDSINTHTTSSKTSSSNFLFKIIKSLVRRS